MSISEPGEVWAIASTAAWVDVEPDAIAVLDLRTPATSRPVLVPEPSATLWRALGQGPLTRAALVEVAAATEPPPLAETGWARAQAHVDALTSTLGACGLLVSTSPAPEVQR